MKVLMSFGNFHGMSLFSFGIIMLVNGLFSAIKPAASGRRFSVILLVR